MDISLQLSLSNWLSQYYMVVEMGRSLANAEARLKNLAECSARQHVTIRQKFSVICGFVLWHFVLAAVINLKLLYLLLVCYQLTNRPTTYMQYTTN